MSSSQSLPNFPAQEEDGYSSDASITSIASCASTVDLSASQIAIDDETVPESDVSDANESAKEADVSESVVADRVWVAGRDHEEIRDCFGLYMGETEYSSSHAPIDNANEADESKFVVADRVWVAGRNHEETHDCFGSYTVDVEPSTSHAPINNANEGKPWMRDFHEADREWVAIRDHEETRDCFGLYTVGSESPTSHAPISMIESFHRWRWFKIKSKERKRKPAIPVLYKQWNHWIKNVYVEPISDDSGVEFPVSEAVPYAVEVVANSKRSFTSDTTVYTAVDLISPARTPPSPIDTLEKEIENFVEDEEEYMDHVFSLTDREELPADHHAAPGRVRPAPILSLEEQLRIMQERQDQQDARMHQQDRRQNEIDRLLHRQELEIRILKGLLRLDMKRRKYTL